MMKYKKCKCAKCGSEVLRMYKRKDAECFTCIMIRKRERARVQCEVRKLARLQVC